jgi:hypothetical protein
MILFALNAAAIIGINIVLMKLNFPLMGQVIIIFTAIVKIATMNGNNTMSLSILLRGSEINNAFVA